MTFQIFGEKAEATKHEGIFIPAVDLAASGLSIERDLGEDSAPEIQRDRLILGIVDTLTARIADLPPELRLGLSATRPNFQSLSWKFELTFLGSVGFDSPGGIRPLPIPTTGINAGKGEVSLAEIWPGVKKLAAGVNHAAPGILIAANALRPYWGGNHADISPTGDGRAVLWALFRWLASPSGAPRRGKDVKSAITGKTVSPGVATRPQTGNAAALYGFSPEQLETVTLLTFSASLSFALLLSRKAGRSWDVNCALG